MIQMPSAARMTKPIRDQAKNSADGAPKQLEPEGAYLPAVVRFEPRAARVVLLHVVDDHRDDPGDADEEARRLQRVGHGGHGLEIFLVGHSNPLDHDALLARLEPGSDPYAALGNAVVSGEEFHQRLVRFIVRGTRCEPDLDALAVPAGELGALGARLDVQLENHSPAAASRR